MPRKHSFSKAERWAVWSAHNGCCFWCAEPFDFKFCTVDHVIPERLQNNTSELAEIIRLYGLKPDFDVNDFSNWVPAHQHCNGSKASLIFASSPVFLLALSRSERKGAQARAFHEKFNNDRAMNNILAQLEIGLEMKTVPLERVQELVRATMGAWNSQPAIIENLQASASNQEDPVLLIGGWTLHQRSGDIAYVMRNGQFGYTYVGRGNASEFMCPHCGQLGPWNGARCLTCGVLSDPGD